MYRNFSSGTLMGGGSNSNFCVFIKKTICKFSCFLVFEDFFLILILNAHIKKLSGIIVFYLNYTKTIYEKPLN